METSREAIEFHLDFTYEGQERPALRGVEGTVPRGSCVVLCGRSGCGKSTVLRCLNQLIPQFYEGRLRGFCRLAGEDLAGKTIGQAGRLAASVFQDPRSQFFTMNSSTEVAFGLENFGFSHEEIVRRTEEAFARFHLEGLRDRNVFALSSGQRQLVAILSAWAMDTDLFLLDEPTANLDPGAIRELGALLGQIKAQGKTILLSEHRLAYLRDVADEYWVMEAGALVRRLTGRELLRLDEEERRSLGLRTPDNRRIVRTPPACLPEPGERHCFRGEGITFSYGKHRVLRAMELEVSTGEVLGLIGANGCGKTTFGKTAGGLLRPSGGRFLMDGKPLSSRQLRSMGIFVMQEAEFQFFTNSVWNELTYGLKDRKKRAGELEGLLRQADLWDSRNQHPFSLSGGQMQKLVLLLACLSPKPLVILDEPTAGLDWGSLESCGALIEELRKTKAVLLITHDPELIGRVCTRCIRMEDGREAETYLLQEPGAFAHLMEDMGRIARRPEPLPPPAPRKPRLDPRLKLLMLLASMVVGIWTDLPLILMTFLGILGAAMWERRWKLALPAGGVMGLLFLLYLLFPTAAFSFLAYFFPRILLIAAAAGMIVTRQEAPRTLAGLRRLHIPEGIIMVCSVTFRFFPVLQADLRIMHQSIQTRGFFPTVGSRLRAIPRYAEILIVPMVFRVIRIAEALSASAETRGIALKGRRESYISLTPGPADLWVLLVFAGCVTAGILL